MKTGKTFRMLIIALALALSAVFLPATPALALPEITLSPTSGAVGTVVTVSGTGFESFAGTEVSLFLAGEEIADSPITVPTSGTFNVELTVPDDIGPGVFDVRATTMLGGEIIKTFTVREPEMEIDLDEGPVASEVTVSGSGMFAGGAVDIYYYREGSRLNVGEVVAGPTGGFSHTFSIPESIQGSHRIIAEDVQDNVAETSFEVIPTMQVGASSGAIGDELSITGNGFTTSSNVSLYFNNVDLIQGETNRYGSFELSATVPNVAAGDYDIAAEDGNDNRTVVAFIVTAGATISPVEGAVGASVIVDGVGFKAVAVVTINYDDEEITTAVTDASGAFSVSFVVPPSAGGPHPVTVSDGTNTASPLFTVETQAPSAPELLTPGEDSRAAAAAEFEWENVSDDSGVTYTLQVATKDGFTESQVVLEVVGLTDPEYTLAEDEELEPSSKEAPHYWRVKAVDGAGNESEWSAVGSFHVGSSFTLPVTALRVLIGLAIAGAGFFGFWLGRRTAYAKQN